MSNNQIKSDFGFDYIIESPRPSIRSRPSDMRVSLLVLLTITIAAALFVHPSGTVVTLPAHESVVARAS